MYTERPFRRHHGAINAGSMADIAFLLLIFFLVTTTIDKEVGLPRLLSPVSETAPAPIAARNLFLVRINEGGELLVRDQRSSLEELPERALAFLTNPDGREDLPRMTTISDALCAERIAALGQGPERAAWEQRLETVRMIGPYREAPAEATMLIQAAGNTPYEDHILVQDVLERAVAGIREALALRAFGHSFKDLDEYDPIDRVRIRAIQRAAPMRVGDAELVAVP